MNSADSKPLKTPTDCGSHQLTLQEELRQICVRTASVPLTNRCMIADS
jgi:hypothetical protein